MEERTSEPLTQEMKQWMQQMGKESGEVTQKVQDTSTGYIEGTAASYTSTLQEMGTETRRLEDTEKDKAKEQAAKLSSQIDKGRGKIKFFSIFLYFKMNNC